MILVTTLWKWGLTMDTKTVPVKILLIWIGCHIVLLIWREQMAPLATLGGIYRLSHCFTYMEGTNGSISHLGWYL